MVRNVVYDPRVLPGGGATEMAIAHAINTKVRVVALVFAVCSHIRRAVQTIEGPQSFPFRSVALAMEVIPK